MRSGRRCTSNPLTQESLTAIVDDGQVSCLIYWSPMEIVRTENESVALLPFAQVQQRFWEQIFAITMWMRDTRSRCASRMWSCR